MMTEGRERACVRARERERAGELLGAAAAGVGRARRRSDAQRVTALRQLAAGEAARAGDTHASTREGGATQPSPLAYLGAAADSGEVDYLDRRHCGGLF